MVLACQVTRRNRPRFKLMEAMARNEIGPCNTSPKRLAHWPAPQPNVFNSKRRGDPEMADQADKLDAPLKPAPPVAKSGEWWRPSNHRGSAEPSPPPSQKAEPQSEPSSKQVDLRTMVVGSGTSFSGEITSCNRLIVEGTVEAKLDNCKDVLINEGGLFKGESATENADIHGAFEGDLVVRKRLLVRSTGRLSGTITYGEIEIERGGKISGIIQASGERAIPNTVRAAAAKTLAMNGHGRRSARPKPETEDKESASAAAQDRTIPGI